VLRKATSWNRDASAKSYKRHAFSVSRKSGKTLFIMKETLWKNNLNFVDDVPTMYVSFIIIVTAFLESFVSLGDTIKEMHQVLAPFPFFSVHLQ
jgi:hypothetical protein